MAVRLGVPEAVAGIPLVRRLAWVVGARVGFLVVATSALAFVNVKHGFDAGATTIKIVVAVVALSFALAGVYAAVLRTGKGLVELATAQLVLDQATWTVLVYVTGGATSGATSFYGLTCLLGGFLIGLRGSAIAAVTGIGFYAVLVLALFSGRLMPPADQPPTIYAVSGEQLASYLLLNVLVVVIVTLLTSYLADRLRAAGGRIVEAEARAESAERLAVLGRLAAGLAHEIRNPLGSIAGSAQLLRTSQVLSEEDRKLCEIIQREAARLNDLVSDMMDVARARKPELRTVDTARLAREVVALASRSGRAVSDVKIVFSGEESLCVRADASQLRQLIWNLVRNAVQASTAGGSVGVRVEDSGGTGVLVVEDDGVGIDADAKERLFDAFFSTRTHGTGIGLAVVKRIADEHAFTIDVESEKGRGARFRVTLGPRVPADGTEMSLPPHLSSVPPPP
ncbi:MAG TPA: ATP-binding protein [Polyangiaceae bacterium]|jgi:signal transduction histidine kinase|nr:ATP-binding protein [Polyangiaceae bacterium]